MKFLVVIQLCFVFCIQVFSQHVVIDYSKSIAEGNPQVFGGTQPRGLSDSQWDKLKEQGFTFMRSQADLTLLVPCSSPEEYTANVSGCSNPENWNWKDGIYGDDFVQRAIDRGMSVCLVIKNARWNRYDKAPDDEETMPRDLEVWQDIVMKIINHYKGKITYIECFNEVDRSPQFIVEGSTYSKEKGYREVVYAAIQAAKKSKYPETKIGGTAAAGFGFDELQWLLKDERIKDNLGFVSFHDFDNPDYPHQNVNKLKNILREYSLEVDIVRSSYTPEFGRNHPLSEPGTAKPEYVAPHIFGALKDGLAATGLWEIQNREGENDFRYWFDNEDFVPTAMLFKLLSDEYKLGKGKSEIVDVTGLDFSMAFGAINVCNEYVGAFVNIGDTNENFRLSIKGAGFTKPFQLQVTLISEGTESVFYSDVFHENDETDIQLPAHSVLGFKIIPTEHNK